MYVYVCIMYVCMYMFIARVNFDNDLYWSTVQIDCDILVFLSTKPMIMIEMSIREDQFTIPQDPTVLFAYQTKG